VTTIFCRAQSYIMIEQFYKALADITVTLALRPKDGMCFTRTQYTNLGCILHSKGIHEEGILQVETRRSKGKLRSKFTGMPFNFFQHFCVRFPPPPLTCRAGAVIGYDCSSQGYNFCRFASPSHCRTTCRRT
jgi:hypothetical protein